MTQTTTPPSPPSPTPPAFMRNYHEVLRNDLHKVLSPSLVAGDVAAFATAWRAYVQAISVHASMEDGVPGAGQGSVAMLNHYFNNIIDAQTFRREHEHEHAVQAEVTRAIDGPLEALRKVFEEYVVLAEAHLKHEEDLMQPLVVQLPDPKAPKFAQWCASAGISHGGMEQFLSHGVQSLSQFGSGKNPPAVAARVFVHAAQSIFSAQEWAHYGPVMRDAAPPALWAAMIAEVPVLGIGLAA